MENSNRIRDLVGTIKELQAFSDAKETLVGRFITTALVEHMEYTGVARNPQVKIAGKGPNLNASLRGLIEQKPPCPHRFF